MDIRSGRHNSGAAVDWWFATQTITGPFAVASTGRTHDLMVPTPRAYADRPEVRRELNTVSPHGLLGQSRSLVGIIPGSA